LLDLEEEEHGCDRLEQINYHSNENSPFRNVGMRHGNNDLDAAGRSWPCKLVVHTAP
jgi:hypothetical protein